MVVLANVEQLQRNQVLEILKAFISDVGTIDEPETNQRRWQVFEASVGDLSESQVQQLEGFRQMLQSLVADSQVDEPQLLQTLWQILEAWVSDVGVSNVQESEGRWKETQAFIGDVEAADDPELLKGRREVLEAFVRDVGVSQIEGAEGSREVLHAIVREFGQLDDSQRRDSSWKAFQSAVRDLSAPGNVQRAKRRGEVGQCFVGEVVVSHRPQLSQASWELLEGRIGQFAAIRAIQFEQ